jgi:hypothetical protein
MSDTGQSTAEDIEAQFKAEKGGMPGPLTTSDATTGVPSGYTFQGRTKIRTATGAEQDLYDIRKEANTILSTMDDGERQRILEGLKSKGIGYSARQKVGNGFSDADRNAFSECCFCQMCICRTTRVPITCLCPRWHQLKVATRHPV